MTSILQASDLFCGLGGFSAGLLAACHDLQRRPQLLAINHWPKAIDTHRLNHPGVNHLCENLDNVEPRKIVQGGRLNILLASPECTHFSAARGGKPMSDQSRASAWHVVRWAEALRIDNIVVENVKEFETWGPLDSKGRPIKDKRGEIFRAWLNCFEAMGYKVDKRILNSADFGAATARERLFIQMCRKRRPRWPARTHYDPSDSTAYDCDGQGELLSTAPYRAAREIIDWNLEGQSIFRRKKPLADKTLKRIAAGLKKFNGIDFIVGAGAPNGAGHPHSVDEPLGTVLGQNHPALIQPFLVVLRNHADGRSLDEPTPTLCAGGGHLGLCEPFIVPVTHSGGEGRAYSVENPLPTITGAQRGEMALCEPFIIPYRGERKGQQPRCHSIDAPFPTVCTENGHALIEPFLVPFKRNSTAASIEAPLGTLTTHDCYGLAEPFFVQYYGNSDAAACSEPLPTVTGNDRFGLCEPEPVAILERDGVTYALLDIRFRMLQPHELAAAMGLDGYSFPDKTTKKDKTKMVGNAVEKNTSRALCTAVLQ